MKIYLTSDIHFFHDNIVKYCKRYTNIDEYSEDFLKKCESEIPEESIFLFLGDLACSKRKDKEILKQFISRIPSKIKIFIRGNHDYWLTDEDIKEIGFDIVRDFIKYKDILFCHYPLRNITELSKEAPDILRHTDFLKGIKTIYHGHSHNNPSKKIDDGIDRINCCVDRITGEIADFIILDF